MIELAFPALSDLATFSIVLAAGFCLTYIFSKALKLNCQPIQIANKKKEAFRCIAVCAAVVAVTFGIYAFYDSVWVRTTLVEDPVYVVRDALWIIAILLPAAVAMWVGRQNLGSVGISRVNFKKNLALGFMISLAFMAIIVLLAPSVGGSFAGFSSRMVYALLSAVIIGFGEELVFRGYIQTRLTAQSGAVVGVAGAAVLFAVFQFPVGYYCFKEVVPGLFYALWRLSEGLVFGYMFHKSQSIIPSAIFHGLLVWWALQWALYF